MYGYLADAVVAAHVLYVAYVLLGQAAIIVAGTLRREWGRNPYFRFSHLLLMAIVAVEAVMGWRCPLTVWEEQLRAAGGELVTGESFLGRLLHNLLFIEGKPESFFTTIYIAMMIVVLQALVMYPPRRFGRRHAAETGRMAVA